MPNPLATTAILIRHGERDETVPDPHLNAAGKARAQTLIHVVGKSGIKAIYTSQAIRTKETAQPLALQLGLSPMQIEEAAKIKNDILSKHAGQTVLVVGHTDTIPELIKQFAAGSNFNIAAQEFDKLFIVTVFDSSRAQVTELKFGNPN